VAPEEQLAWEKRAGRPAAAAAFVSALLGLATIAVSSAYQTNHPIGDRVEEYLRIHNHGGPFVAILIFQAISLALLAPVLYFLYRAAKSRLPEIPRALLPISLVAPPLLALGGVISSIEQIAAADRVAAKLPLPPKAALDLADDELAKGAGGVLPYVGLVLAIVFAFAIGMVAMNARRAGLLSQFMGILGVIGGIWIVLNFLLGPALVLYYWTAAMGLLFIDRWPGNGRGPAWETGEADPWPTAAEIRAAQQGDGGDPPARPEPRPAPRWLERLAGTAGGGDGSSNGADDLGETPEPRPLAPAQHPRSKKRKKKKRR
jgi:hypothetical protein